MSSQAQASGENGNSSVGMSDDYCETVAAVSHFLREHASHTKDDSTRARCISERESAHWKGECYGPLNGRQPIFALVGYHDIRTLEGRLLTIVDAAFSDREQRKAFKDLVRAAIWVNWVRHLDTDDPSGGVPT